MRIRNSDGGLAEEHECMLAPGIGPSKGAKNMIAAFCARHRSKLELLEERMTFDDLEKVLGAFER